MAKSEMKGGDERKKGGITRNPFLRLLLLVSGWIFVGLATVGVALPLVPTTPFLLLAALCFYKSSPRFYSWLFADRIFGPYLLDYKEKKGIPVRVKVWTLLFMWTSLLVSFFLVSILWVRILLVMIGIAVTVHILMIRTKRP